MSKLNAFLAAVPGNGLPSPSAHKSTTAPVNKSFPTLSIPQADDEDDGGYRASMDQPATPQPLSHRLRQAPTPRMASQRKSDGARHSFGGASEEFGLKGFDSSNQEEVETTKSPEMRCASTPAKHSRFSGLNAPQKRMEDEAGPMKRMSVANHQQVGHHRRISTNTAMFSKILKKQPNEDIDTNVVRYFSQVPVSTISRPEQTSNQLDEETNLLDTASSGGSALDPLEIMETFKRGETVPVGVALTILKKATSLMHMEPNVLAVKAPFTVVGDLHGQFRDLVEIFNVHGAPCPSNPFLFLGDYVDRGVASCEIILTLLAFKLCFPTSVHLLRGNHECRALSTFYGFRAECVRKYGILAYNRMIKCFESMPLAARIETSYGCFLAVHGGLSPEITRVDDINLSVNRFMEPEPSGALCDILWADPAKEHDAQDQPWAPNRVRGCSYTFNADTCRSFLKENNLLAIIRAHELEEKGFREHFQEIEQDSRACDPLARLPPVITVFSAPEYCNTNHNMGATLVIPWEYDRGHERVLEYRQHRRSSEREAEFSGSSEQDFVRQYLSEHLPFLPVDFYELVVVCRHLRATLEVASSVPTPAPSSASNIMVEGSGATTSQQTQSEHTLRPPIDLTINRSTSPHQEDRRSSDHTSTEDEQPDALSTSQQALPATGYRNSTGKPVVLPHGVRAHRRASTGSGFRFCPGFVRFCEKFLGLRFPQFGPSKSRTKEKRGSIDDIHIGTSSIAKVLESPPGFTHGIDITSKVKPVPAKDPLDIFTPAQWTALRLYFELLDVNGTGVLVDEGFVVLLAEQDSDAYASQEELALLLDAFDCNGDGLITAQDFLQFAYRALLRWKKNGPTGAPK